MNPQLRQRALATAQQTIQIEQAAIAALYDNINDDFLDVVAHIFATSGRVILTGIGKSAIVAQKTVATLNSTGTPALFMHAADAIHGDLGMIQPNDIVICLSKSGETPEIRALIPAIKSLGNTLVAIVANPDTTLGRLADHTLVTPISREADPNNLAPTTSTTAQMVLGDAIATSLIAIRGFTPTDFATYHPGGALGKQLNLRVADISQQHGKPAVEPNTPIRNVILEITIQRLGAAAVIDTEGKLVGIITDGDLRRMLEKYTDLTHITAADIYCTTPKTIAHNALATEAIRMMRQHNISQLIVLDDKQYIGIIHIHDLLREGLI